MKPALAAVCWLLLLIIIQYVFFEAIEKELDREKCRMINGYLHCVN